MLLITCISHIVWLEDATHNDAEQAASAVYAAVPRRASAFDLAVVPHLPLHMFRSWGVSYYIAAL